MKFELAPHQMQFLLAPEKFVLLAGGIGSGKSFAGAHYVIKKINENPKSLGFIGANTYKQLHNATLACLFREFEVLGIPFNYNQNKGILSVLGAKILCASMENYDVLRGIEIGWFWLDEVRDTKQDAFDVLMGRLRDKRELKHEGRLTSSPSGFNWLYDYFKGERKTSQFRIVEAASQDNPFLPDGYIQTLRDNYDTAMYQQEVLGMFVNISQGRIYYAFDRNRQASERVVFNPRLPIWVGMDFNVNPMTATLAHVRGNSIHVFDEIYLMTSNTDEVADTIKEKYGRGHSIVPDSTGKALKTSAAGRSDHIILEQAGFKVMKTENPFRVDRYNCVNNMLEKGLLKIDPSCKKLIRDLEQVSYKEGSTLPDVSKDKTLTHISDSVGYLCWFVNPLIRPQKARMLKR